MFVLHVMLEMNGVQCLFEMNGVQCVYYLLRTLWY